MQCGLAEVPDLRVRAPPSVLLRIPVRYRRVAVDWSQTGPS